jgi:exosortase
MPKAIVVYYAFRDAGLGEVQAVNRVLLQDLAWALLVGVVVGVSPHIPGNHLVVEIAGGIAAAVLVLGYRVVRRRRSSETAANGVGPLAAASKPPAALWVVLLLSCAVFAPTLVWLYGEWTESIWRNGHGLFLPFIMFFLARSILRRDSGEDDVPSLWGLSFAAAGLILAVLGSAVPLYNLSALGLVLFLPGLCLLVLGVRRSRALAPVLWLGLLMVSVPTSLATHVSLPLASAAAAEPVLALLGIPVVRDAATLTVPNGVWALSNRCSGFSVLVAATGASIFLAFYSRSWLRRVVLLLSPWFLVVICNSLRTVVLAAFVEFTGILLHDAYLHGASGIGTFWVVMGALFVMADRQRLRERFG